MRNYTISTNDTPNIPRSPKSWQYMSRLIRNLSFFVTTLYTKKRSEWISHCLWNERSKTEPPW